MSKQTKSACKYLYVICTHVGFWNAYIGGIYELLTGLVWKLKFQTNFFFFNLDSILLAGVGGGGLALEGSIGSYGKSKFPHTTPWYSHSTHS